MTINWTAADGTPQEINLKQLIEHEQYEFIRYSARIKNPTPLQAKRIAERLQSIDYLQSILSKYQEG